MVFGGCKQSQQDWLSPEADWVVLNLELQGLSTNTASQPKKNKCFNIRLIYRVSSEPLGTFPTSSCGTRLSGHTHIPCRDIPTSILTQGKENHFEVTQACRAEQAGDIPTTWDQVLQCARYPLHYPEDPTSKEPTRSSGLAQRFSLSEQGLLNLPYWHLCTLLNHGHTGCVCGHDRTGERADPRSLLGASGRRQGNGGWPCMSCSFGIAKDVSYRWRAEKRSLGLAW